MIDSIARYSLVTVSVTLGTTYRDETFENAAYVDVKDGHLYVRTATKLVIYAPDNWNAATCHLNPNKTARPTGINKEFL